MITISLSQRALSLSEAAPTRACLLGISIPCLSKSGQSSTFRRSAFTAGGSPPATEREVGIACVIRTDACNMLSASGQAELHRAAEVHCNGETRTSGVVYELHVAGFSELETVMAQWRH